MSCDGVTFVAACDSLGPRILRSDEIENATLSNGVFWDVRQLRALHMDPSKLDALDVRLRYQAGLSMKRALESVNMCSLVEHLISYEKKMSSHIRAAKQTGIDVRSADFLLHCVPREIVNGLLCVRASAVYSLSREMSFVDDREVDRLVRTQRILLEIERDGIAVDVSKARDFLLDVSLSSATRRSLRSMVESSIDGFVFSQFEPNGVKTGRYRVTGGFGCMSIPHGPARKCVVSRHKGGEIWVVDFNAIDYRCIVSSVEDDDLRSRYKNCEDFHARTASFLFGDSVDSTRRNAIKLITYVYIYGGSDETLSNMTGLSVDAVQRVKRKLDWYLKPVVKFRETLYTSARAIGYVQVPNGPKVFLEEKDHPGKILGLYAQGYSSMIFGHSLSAAVNDMAGLMSRPLFTVHDELVIDVHPEEHLFVVNAIRKMQDAAGSEHVLNVKRGKNYGEAS